MSIKVFAAADYSAVEARVLAWLAGEEWRLEVFRTHGKIYEASASRMFSVPIEQVTKGSELRMRGKVAELALGYQGSTGALTAMGAEDMGLDASACTGIVTAWRKSNPAIVRFWDALNAWTINAVKVKDGIFRQIDGYKLRVAADAEVLALELPSSRRLYYRKPGVVKGRFGQDAVQYRGPTGESRTWGWAESYGGKFTENVVQAVARDLLGCAMLKLDAAGYDIVLHVHDEIVCEVDENTAEQKLRGMCAIMCELPEWATGLPLGADGFISKFYKKGD